MRTELPFVHAYRSKKRWYSYYRRDGQRIPIHGRIVVVAGVIRPSDEWMANYEKIHASFENHKPLESQKKGTMDDLIVLYKGDPEYLQLAKKTRSDYSRYLNILQEHYGPTMITYYDMETVTAIRNI